MINGDVTQWRIRESIKTYCWLVEVGRRITEGDRVVRIRGIAADIAHD